MAATEAAKASAQVAAVVPTTLVKLVAMAVQA
jgi:hypothetical protein